VKVLVVGGGIIGCASAFELAKAGCAVTLFERATPGAEASGAAAGLLAPIDESASTAFAQLALESWRRYPEVVAELRERTGIDVDYVTRGTIYPLATTEDVRRAEA
jgi:glycine oxidase